MYLNNIFYLMPEIFLSLSIVSLLAYGVVYSKIDGHVSQLKNITYLSILTLIITGILNLCLYKNSDVYVSISNGIFGINNSIILIKTIILISGIVILLLSLRVYEIRKEKINDYEFSQLILLAILGMLLLVLSKDLIIMYLSIETLSLSLYVLASIRRTGQYSTEAGLKYFVLGALSSGLLLFGCALIYIVTGLTSFDSLSNYVWLTESNEIGVQLGAGFILMAVLFKLAAAPFHNWSPDVYEGSPTIVTAFFAIVPKIAILTLLINLVYGPFLSIFENGIQHLILFSGVLSIAIGSIAAINQTKIKRLLAFSAIAHIGWILLGIGIGTLISIQASLIYIILYIVMSINTFTFVLSLYKNYGNNYIVELSGLSRKNSILAITFSLSLLSIAGIPPLAGFFSKYNILLTLIDENYIIISVLSIVLSVIGSFYYIRIIQWMYFNNSKDYVLKDAGDIIINEKTGIDLIRSLILGATFFIILTALIYPTPLLVLTFDSINSILI